MSKSYFPTRDADALQFVQNFGNRIQVDPTKYGQTAASAALYQGLVGDFSTKLTLATDPATRTALAVAEKNAALAAVRTETSYFVKAVRAQKNLTPAEVKALGLEPIKERQQTQEEPAMSPLLSAQAVGPRSINVVLRDGLTKRKALPPAIKGASVLSLAK